MRKLLFFLISLFSATTLLGQTLEIQKVTTSGCYYSGGSKCIVSVQVGWTGLVSGNDITVTLGAQTKTIEAESTPAYSQIVTPQVVAFEITSDGTSGNVTASVLSLTDVETYTAASPCAPLVCNSGDLGGQVYYDYNNDGVHQVTETQGRSGVSITVTDVNGTVYTTTSDNMGKWKLLVAGGNYPVRVEYSNIPAGLRSSTTIAGGTTVQFYNSSTCSADVGVLDVTDYTQSNPLAYVPLWANGDPAHASLSSRYSISRFNYNTVGYPQGGGQISNNGIIPYSYAGTLWGVAWDRENEILYSSAMIRRHAGLGTMGIAGVYAYDAVANTYTGYDLESTTGVDFGSIGSNASRGLGALTSPSWDIEGYSKVGKEGIGAISVNETGTTMYVMNLYLKQIVVVNLPAMTLNKVINVPDPGCGSSGTYRPWSCTYYKGKLYLGVVCDGGVSGNKSDMFATVYEMDPVTEAYTSILDFPLTYPKGYPNSSVSSGWNAWTDNYMDMVNSNNATGAGENGGYPTPILADIDFDVDGAMVLALDDRTASQFGYRNYLPDPLMINTTLWRANAGGDILRAYYSNGVYAIENAGKSGPNTGSHLSNNEGPGFGEFFNDNFTCCHTETMSGGLAIKPGSGEVAGVFMDPNNTTSQIFAGGVKYLNNSNGAYSRAYSIYGGSNNLLVFGKSNGLGDITFAADNPDFSEIGNRIWADSDADGVQDPGEPGINGVHVCLYDALGNLVTTTTTSGDGNYYFGNGVSGVNLTAGATYYIVAGCGDYSTTNGLQVGLNRYGILTHANTGEGPDPDNNDNDGTIAGVSGVEANFTGLPFVQVTAPAHNTVNHTFDFGFATARLGNYVWLDVDLNGLQNEAPSSGLNGVTVQLYKDDGLGNFNLENSTVTANDGSSNPGYYEFTIYTPGNYKVKFPTLYTTYELTTVNQTAQTDGNSDANLSTGYSEVVAMNPIGSATDRLDLTLDAGYAECSVTAPVMSGDQTVCSLTDPNAFTISTAATGSGTLSYQWQSSTVNCSSGFSDISGETGSTMDPSALAVTTYFRVIVTNSTGGGSCTATSNCITITVYNPGSIGNYVWNDINHDGLQNESASAGINGVTVELYKETSPGSNTYTLDQSTVTANNGGNPGYYNFNICTSANYKVKFPVNSGDLTLTTTDNSAATNGNSDADQTSGETPVFSIDVNGSGTAKNNPTLDAGYHLPPPVLRPYPNKHFCLGSNIQLIAYGAPGATFNWTTPVGFTGSIDNSVSGKSVITINNLTAPNNGAYTVTQTLGVNTSTVSNQTVDAGARASYNYVATSCVSGMGHIILDVTPNVNMEFSMNGGPFQTSNVFDVPAGSVFVASVREIGSSCESYYSGECAYCPNTSGCTMMPHDTLTAPDEVCPSPNITLTNSFSNASMVTFSSNGTGTFDVSTCNSSPCTVHYTPSQTDMDNGSIIVTITTDDPDGAGPCMPHQCSKNILLLNGLVPPVISTNDPVCENSELIITHNGIHGSTSWLGANGYTSTQQTDTITSVPYSMNGILTATLTAEGCTPVNATKSVTIIGAPTLNVVVTPVHEQCAGQGNGAIQVAVTGGSGNYQICYNATLSNCVNAANANFQYVGAGNYTVTVVDQSCPNNIYSYPVTINPGILVAPPTVPSVINGCQGSDLVLSGTSTGTINWTFGGNNFNALGNTVTRFNAQTWMSGIYRAKTIALNGCASMPVDVQVEVGVSPTIVHVQVNCISSSAHIEVTASGPGTLQYSLDGLVYQSSNIFDGTPGGNYLLHVKSLTTNCVTTLSIHVPNCACPNEPVIDVTYPENSCGLTAIPLTATWSNASSASWTTGGTGNFNVSSGASPFSNTYTPSAADLLAGTVNLSITTVDPDGAGPCAPVTSTIHLHLVSSLPTPVISASQLSYCTGDSVALSTNTTLPLHWSGPGGFSSDSDIAWIPNATQFVSGAYTASLTGNGCSTTSSVYNLVVAAAPSLTVSTSVVDEMCEGHGNGQITVNVTGGTGTYKICDDFEINCNTTTAPYTFKYLGPQTYTIYVSDATCLNSRTSSVATVHPGIHVPMPLTASYNSSSLCEGDDLVLTATGTGGLDFLWTDKTNNWLAYGAVVTREDALPAMSGPYTVVQIDNGCASDPLFLDVLVGEFPIVSAVDTFCGGGDLGRITITATNNSGQEIEYALNDGAYQSSNIFDSLSNGLYQVKARSVGTNCETVVPAIVELYCDCHCEKQAVATVFPNPNTGSFTVNLELKEGSENIKLELFDITGRRIYTETTEEQSHFLRRNLSISHLEAGTYTLKVSVDLENFLVPVTVSK